MNDREAMEAGYKAAVAKLRTQTHPGHLGLWSLQVADWLDEEMPRVLNTSEAVQE